MENRRTELPNCRLLVMDLLTRVPAAILLIALAAYAMPSAEARNEPAALRHAVDPESSRRYDGLTLDAWREQIKTLDPASPLAAEAVPGLIQIVKDPEAPWYARRQAALTLGRIGAPAARAVPVLIGLLNEQAGKARVDADPSANPLPSSDRPREAETTSLWATRALALFGPQAKAAAPLLVQRAKDPARAEPERRAALDALARIGPSHPLVVPSLIEILRSADQEAEFRALAAEAIGAVGPGASSALPALIRALHERSEPVRRKAAQALGAIGRRAEPAIPALAELLVFDPAPAVRDRAADAMAKIGAPAVAILTGLLRDTDPQTRRRAAGALGSIGPEAKPAVPALRKSLNDENASVRISAAESLWKITTDARLVLPPLLTELQNSDRQVRIRAYRLLLAMGSDAKPAAARLKEMLNDERPYVRQVAAEALKKLRQPIRQPK